MHDDRLYASCPAVADGHFVPFHDDRDLSDTAGVFKHLFKIAFLGLDVQIGCLFTIGRPGLVRVRSAPFAVDDDFLCHVHLLKPFTLFSHFMAFFS